MIELLDSAEEISIRWSTGDEQAFCDLVFIRKFAAAWSDGWTKVSERVEDEIVRVGSMVSFSYLTSCYVLLIYIHVCSSYLPPESLSLMRV